MTYVQVIQRSPALTGLVAVGRPTSVPGTSPGCEIIGKFISNLTFDLVNFDLWPTYLIIRSCK